VRRIAVLTLIGAAAGWLGACRPARTPVELPTSDGAHMATLVARATAAVPRGVTLRSTATSAAPPPATGTPGEAASDRPAPTMATGTATDAPAGANSPRPTAGELLWPQDVAAQMVRNIPAVLQPRVERAFLVRESAVRAADPDGQARWLLGGSVDPDEPPSFPAEGSDRLIGIALVSNRGIDMRGPGAPLEGLADNSSVTSPNVCVPVPATRRQAEVAVFDAETGNFLGGSMIALPAELGLIDDLAAVRLRHVPPARARSAAYESPTPPPPQPTPWLPQPLAPDATAVPLGYGEVPAALAANLTDWPAAVGSSWTYDVREVDADIYSVRWYAGRLTETVDAAWMLAPDVMLSRIHHTGTSHEAIGYEQADAYSYRYTFANGIVGDMGTADLAAARRILADGSRTADPPIAGFLRLPLQPPDANLGYGAGLVGASVEDTALGRLRDCYIVERVGNAGAGHNFRLCRGIGTVRRDMPYCWSQHGSFELNRLVAYRLPALRVLPGTVRPSAATRSPDPREVPR
jgi:hypothetical protein